MKFQSKALTLLLLSAKNVIGQLRFTDSRGKTISRNSSSRPPRIVINAVGAISLFHMGLPKDQLVAVYDHWVVRGSDQDLDDPSNDFQSNFELDPDAAEFDFLRSAKDLSPSCSGNSNGCFFDINLEELVALDYDYFIVQRAALAEMTQWDSDISSSGKTLIWIDDQYEHGTNCYINTFEIANPSNCAAASVIDTVQRIEELSTFLGVNTNAPQVLSDRQLMCQEAANFVSHTESLHIAGLKAAAISLRPQNGGVISVFNPTAYPWLRTLEELGMPLIHVLEDNTSVAQRFTPTEWFIDCANLAECVEVSTTAFPVDFFLLDSRSYTPVVSGFEDIVRQFPDPALTKRQFSYFLFNDGALSYKNIAKFLKEIREASTGLSRVHVSAGGGCVVVDVTSREHNSATSDGLSDGEVACFDRKYLQSLYTECPNVPILDSNAATSAGASPFAGIYLLMALMIGASAIH